MKEHSTIPESEIDNILTWMSLSSPKSGALPLSYFDNAEPLTLSYIEQSEGGHLRSLVNMLDEVVTPRDVDGMIDVSIVGGVGVDNAVFLPSEERLAFLKKVADGEEELKQADGHTYSFTRVRTIPFNRCRGARKIFPTMCEVACAVVKEDATHRSIKLPVGWNGTKWEFAGIGDSPWHRVPSVEKAKLAARLQFIRRYDWRVSLGYVGCPSIAFITDPIGVREVFRLRDIPEGRSRRAALRHWVKEHWRSSRTDPAEEVKVREHLRGATEFTWNGLRCRVVPSAFDRERSQTQRNDRVDSE